MSDHIVYKTTNLINGKFYVGVHKQTEDHSTFDGYYGSGKVLNHAIAKYGQENFERVVLKSGLSKQEAYSLERELLSLASRKVCYNLHEGGLGGFDYVNSTGQNNNGDHQKGEGNSQFGKVYYCNPSDLKIKPKSYFPGTQPDGWAPSTLYKNQRRQLLRYLSKIQGVEVQVNNLSSEPEIEPIENLPRTS